MFLPNHFRCLTELRPTFNSCCVNQFFVPSNHSQYDVKFHRRQHSQTFDIPFSNASNNQFIFMLRFCSKLKIEQEVLVKLQNSAAIFRHFRFPEKLPEVGFTIKNHISLRIHNTYLKCCKIRIVKYLYICIRIF